MKDKYEKKFNNHYIKYRLEYYTDIIKKYNVNKNVKFDYNIYYNIENINENQHKIILDIFRFYIKNIYLELKPSLSDDYPCVLRKLQTQIELTKKMMIMNKTPYLYYLLKVLHQNILQKNN